MAIRGNLDRREALAYMLVQIVGGCLGALFAHLMVGLDPFQLRTCATMKPGTSHGAMPAKVSLSDRARSRRD